jgi:sortase A
LKRKFSILLLVFLLAGGGYFSFQAIKIDVKATVAQVLLDYTWNKSLKENKPFKPWSSFDGSPILKLEIPRYNISQIVLEGTSGQALAFGPAFHKESFLPSSNKITAISSHRDSHGEYIKNLEIGDILKLQDLDNNWHSYKIEEFLIVNVKDAVTINKRNRLLLITCYPFDALLSGTPLRYIVSAININNTHS